MDKQTPPGPKFHIKDEDFDELYESFGVDEDHVSSNEDGSQCVHLLVKPKYYTALCEHLKSKFGSLDSFKIVVGTITCTLD